MLMRCLRAVVTADCAPSAIESVFRSARSLTHGEDVGGNFEQCRQREPDDGQVVPGDRGHEHRAAALDRVATRPLAPLAPGHVPVDEGIVEHAKADGGGWDRAALV